MTGNEYQKKARTFATGGGETMAYAIFGLIEEVGEVCGKLVCADERMQGALKEFCAVGELAGSMAKIIRAEWEEMPKREKLALRTVETEDGIDKELGDVAWMLANVAHNCGLKMDDVLQRNLKKLEDRKRRNVIIGRGDDR